jgi:hypothetical protein
MHAQNDSLSPGVNKKYKGRFSDILTRGSSPKYLKWIHPNFSIWGKGWGGKWIRFSATGGKFPISYYEEFASKNYSNNFPWERR